MIRAVSPLRRPLILFLAAACLGLGAVVFVELTAAPSHSGDPVAASAAIRAPDPAGTPHFSLPPLARFSAVTARPLFSPSRRPAPASATVGPWSSFVLAGVIITPQSREALILHGNPPVAAHIALDQRIDGWTVTSILPDRVVLKHNGEAHEIRLPQNAAAAAAPYEAPRRMPPR